MTYICMGLFQTSSKRSWKDTHGRNKQKVAISDYLFAANHIVTLYIYQLDVHVFNNDVRNVSKASVTNLNIHRLIKDWSQIIRKLLQSPSTFSFFECLNVTPKERSIEPFDYSVQFVLSYGLIYCYLTKLL